MELNRCYDQEGERQPDLEDRLLQAMAGIKSAADLARNSHVLQSEFYTALINIVGNDDIIERYKKFISEKTTDDPNLRPMTRRPFRESDNAENEDDKPSYNMEVDYQAFRTRMSDRYNNARKIEAQRFDESDVDQNPFFDTFVRVPDSDEYDEVQDGEEEQHPKPNPEERCTDCNEFRFHCEHQHYCPWQSRRNW